MKNAKDILTIPGIHYFGGWDNLQKFLKSRGNPPYRIEDEVNLSRTSITSLGNLISVGGDLILFKSKIESLGELQSVGGYLDLRRTPMAKKYTEEDIRNMVDVKGEIRL